MKQNLLFLFFFVFLIQVVSAQVSVGENHCDDCPAELSGLATLDQGDPASIKIFPNPATNYIELTNGKFVEQILIYNVVGKKMKTFVVKDDEKYNVAQLPSGMYLVQLVGHNSKIIKTQRLSKR